MPSPCCSGMTVVSPAVVGGTVGLEVGVGLDFFDLVGMMMTTGSKLED